jgi:hypothetical protein
MVNRNEMAGEDSPEGAAFQLAMRASSADEEPPPILGSWKRFYIVTALYAAAWIVALGLLTLFWR